MVIWDESKRERHRDTEGDKKWLAYCFASKVSNVSNIEERWNILTLEPPSEALLTSAVFDFSFLGYPGRARGGGHLERLHGWRRLTRLTWRLMCLQLKVTIAWTDAYDAHHLGLLFLVWNSFQSSETEKIGMIKAAGRIVLIALQWQTLCSYAYPKKKSREKYATQCPDDQSWEGCKIMKFIIWTWARCIDFIFLNLISHGTGVSTVGLRGYKAKQMLITQGQFLPLNKDNTCKRFLVNTGAACSP